jgi:enediyne biosynthesis protein E4
MSKVTTLKSAPIRAKLTMEARRPGEKLQVGRISCAATLACCFLSLEAAQGQIHYVQVQTSAGLTHNVLYGPPFDFSSDPPDVAQMKRVMQRNMGNGAAVGDYDNDGDQDVYVLGQTGSANRLYRNDFVGAGRKFTNIAAIAGVADTGFGRTAQFADLDNDGWDDLILLNDDLQGGTYSPSRIYRNDANGWFTDVTAGSNFTPTGLIKGGMCLGDYDADGLLDIYVALWLMELGEGNPGFAGHNRLFRNLGNFTFQDVTVSSGLGLLQRDSFSCVFADFDNDADADLYVALDHTSDAYFRNNGDGTFTDRTVAVGATHTGNDMGISVFDFDNDGDLDVYSTNITDSSGIFGTTQFNTLLVNQLEESGTLTFLDQAAARGVKDTYWGWGTEFLDADNDGDLDLYAVNGFDEFVTPFGSPLVDNPEVLFVNDGSGHYSRSNGTGADFISDARAAIAFDYNLDGRQDLLVTSILDPLRLLENQTSDPDPPGHWITVQVVGLCANNADAVGARIYVQDAVTQMREVIAGGSYLSGRPLEQHFGLGSSNFIESIRVVFPDGTEFNKGPILGDRRIAVLHASESEPARMLFSRNLRDIAHFQRCMSDSGGASCSSFDDSGNRDEIIDLADFDDLILALNWTLPGCVAP